MHGPAAYSACWAPSCFLASVELCPLRAVRLLEGIQLALSSPGFQTFAVSEMNPVNATALYISVSRLVHDCDAGNSQPFTEINRLLPFFRQSLACCVCGNLLQDPIAPTNSTCQHYVCRACKGKKMMMKPSCSWCKDYDRFEENKQLSILVKCYRKLCEYIAHSPLGEHIFDTNDGASDILPLLEEGLFFGEESEKHSATVALCVAHSPVPSTSEPNSELETNVSQIPDSTPNVDVGSSSINGLPNCNGLSVDDITVNIHSPENANAVDSCSTGEDFSEDISNSLEPVCETVSSCEPCRAGIVICNFREDMKPEDPLLLSVEEVLQTLDTVSSSEECSPDLQSNVEADAHNGPFTDTKLSPLLLNSAFVSSNEPSHGISCTAVTPKMTRLNRKRSRSESDSEKVQPLPISSIICSPTLASAPTAPVLEKREIKVSIQPVATVPNGGTPKLSKTLFLPSKSIKKNLEHGVKKSHSKAKQGTLKTKEKTKDKVPSNNVMPGSPTKTVYKKPQEKKGCKCGRATQNPSVLTCRGQRCPCYSNRKACLDCICRGCQNSYMANGEKKLEAFAVPEKALEQTRLTLGINVTSIAVRNASTSTSVINVTGSPVTTFLAASAHDDKSLDEAIDLRYDC